MLIRHVHNAIGHELDVCNGGTIQDISGGARDKISEADGKTSADEAVVSFGVLGRSLNGDGLPVGEKGSDDGVLAGFGLFRDDGEQTRDRRQGVAASGIDAHAVRAGGVEREEVVDLFEKRGGGVEMGKRGG